MQVWAIGTGKVATPAIAQDIHAYIRTWLHSHFGEDAASKVSFLIFRIVLDRPCIPGLYLFRLQRVFIFFVHFDFSVLHRCAFYMEEV